MIAPVFEERLRQLGSWLSVNGEAIYASVPWKHQNDTVTSYVWLVQNVIFFVLVFCHCLKIFNALEL